MMSEVCRNSFMTECLSYILSLQSVKIFGLLQLINAATATNYKLLLRLTLIKFHNCTPCQLRNYGSSAIATEVNCPQNLALTLIQILTHAAGDNFSRGQLSRHQKLHNILCYVHY